jgi:hypothetical protein
MAPVGLSMRQLTTVPADRTYEGLCLVALRDEELDCGILCFARVGSGVGARVLGEGSGEECAAEAVGVVGDYRNSMSNNIFGK